MIFKKNKTIGLPFSAFNRNFPSEELAIEKFQTLSGVQKNSPILHLCYVTKVRW